MIQTKKQKQQDGNNGYNGLSPFLQDKRPIQGKLTE